MTDAGIRIVQSTPRFAARSAPLIYDSSHELLDFMFGSRDNAVGALTKMSQAEHGHFGWGSTTVMLAGDEVVGVEIGYDQQSLSEQALPGAIQTLKAVPVSRWFHLMTTVNKIVAGYVPPPAHDAYYINNIAVDASQRGAGLGRKLLDYVIARAASDGYRSVELDVTDVNTGAIRFYRRYGFETVGGSGSAKLAAKHGLPQLIRLRRLAHPGDRPGTVPGHADPVVVNDVTHLNPVRTAGVFAPGSLTQLMWLLKHTDTPICIGGGRFSMGAQTAREGAIQIDMRGMNRVLDLDKDTGVIRVEAGIRWKEIQRHVADFGLAVSIMQTYSNFTVGGSLSVNCHGRYVGLGPVVLSVRRLWLVDHAGTLVEASADDNSEVFYAAIGGYGAIGVIAHAELALAANDRIERTCKKLAVADYPAHFAKTVRNNDQAVFHNADLIPPRFEKARAVTWTVTDKPVNQHERTRLRKFYLPEKYMLWAITETPAGHWRREYLYEPLMYMRPKVTTRNDEADYDVAELEPLSRESTTYVLQEYFVPIAGFARFRASLSNILRRFGVNVINVSVRHAFADPGTLLRWAREEVFAFVLYYKQGTAPAATEEVGVWTRELIDAVIACDGSFYLPYQPHATREQFHRAYPEAHKLFALKDRLDPAYRLRNVLWDKYYRPPEDDVPIEAAQPQSEFRAVYADGEMRDAFYRFLQTIYHLYPEGEFHGLICTACERFDNDDDIYAYLQRHLPGIKTALSDLTYALPALITQKQEMQRQTAQILDGARGFDGYLEIGSTGRYVRKLRKVLDIRGEVYLCNDVVPDMSPPEIMERGGLRQVGSFFPLDDYAPIAPHTIPDDSLDLVTCYIGLHHCPRERLSDYVVSIHRVLRPNGWFVLRDHDAGSERMRTFCSLVHTVFNAGLGVDRETDLKELRLFEDIGFWIATLEAHGFTQTGRKFLQDHDPSLNTLVAFRRAAA